MEEWGGIVWLVVLLLGNAFFVGAEFSIMSARRSQIEPLADSGSGRAATTLRAMEHVSLMLACAQLGITVCSLLLLQVAEPAIHGLIGVPLAVLGTPVEVADTIAFVVALAVVTFLHVTFGEMVPKNIAVSVADRAALILAPALVEVSRFVRPVVVALNWAANGVLKLIRVEPKDEVSSSFTLEEVQSIVEVSTRSGLVADESGLLSGVLEFSDQTVASIMVPVGEIVTLPTSTTPAAFEKAVAKTGFSRFPMVDDDGDLAGYLHVKDVLAIPDAGRQQPIGETRVRSLANIGLDVTVEDALASMQKSGLHVARAIDREGRTRGVLFLEDVIEQLVGEIRDATQSRVRRAGENGIL
ncbi:hemolysin family protein [Sinomonas sp. ASV322]|uniref:hemolysin family protein n=1 Tax=Sinomonas sp. ASV322 TaxID=3041920 RepID=UPI0027DB36E4|nr:hemolysin family protein [Sinomonas sp. ASV322]MDQ4502018.1 hemolysin family protein [Sinomonas sp. ASV322]